MGRKKKNSMKRKITSPMKLMTICQVTQRLAASPSVRSRSARLGKSPMLLITHLILSQVAHEVSNLKHSGKRMGGQSSCRRREGFTLARDKSLPIHHAERGPDS